MQLKKIIQSILEGDENQLDQLYLHYRKPFIKWVKKNYFIDEDLAKDIFQETVITFYFNVKQNKVKDTGSTIKTYLFAIGKNIALNKLRKTKKEIRIDLNEKYVYQLHENNLTEDLFEENETQAFFKTQLAKLGENCQRLLTLFYFDNNSMEAIASKMRYKNDNVAKSQKNRCIKALQKLLKN